MVHNTGSTIPLSHSAVFGAGLKDVVVLGVGLVLRSGFGGVGRSRFGTFVTVP